MKNLNNSRKQNFVLFQVIAEASSGDVEAINKILRHYENYINKLSTRRLFDESGNIYYYIDEDMKRRLETKLITKIVTFEVA